ncbi:MAG: glycosyl hydrolase 115 family protein, partial [Ignavibacteria bacterium]|nr:glycosyl hydrolase 115 family protein [Ignavibacteria bacterium]
DATTVPQVWAWYKEVQEYYDKGMRVPDDVTILLCDDNWGNLRKLPKLTEAPRKGGYGIYYHFDYVGGPRNYKWNNTNQIERVWDQMHLAYEYGAKQIWVVNVGDLKPMEFPISFFLDYAWNPEKISADDLPKYYKNWSAQQFGTKYAEEISELISLYTKYNSRKKPEMLSPETYSLVNYHEAETVVNDYNKLAEKANKVYNELPQEYKDAFYQLVYYPVVSCANLNEMYYAAGLNFLYAKQGRVLTDSLAERVKSLFKEDAELSNYHNKVMAGGKWNHMMDQTHIGYTYWQQPDSNYIPTVYKVEVSSNQEMGVAVESSEKWWPKELSLAKLPEFDRLNNQSYYIEIFNRGKKPFDYEIRAKDSWIQITDVKGRVEKQKKVFVSVDWNKAPKGKSKAMIGIAGPNEKYVPVQIEINNPAENLLEQFNGFVESNNCVSMNAENYSKAVDASGIKWHVISNLGKTGSSVSAYPVTVSLEKPDANSPRLEYNLFLFNEGEVKVKTYFSPTLNFAGNPKGVSYAISFDDEAPQIINMTNHPNNADLHRDPIWNSWVADNINIQVSKHKIDKPGKHVLKFWFVDPGVVLQKIVVETKETKPSYLGQPESYSTRNMK